MQVVAFDDDGTLGWQVHAEDFCSNCFCAFYAISKKLTIKMSHAYLWTRENGTFMLCVCQLSANVHLDNYMHYIIPCDSIAENVESKR